uniref:Amelogenin n=1 Tax=Laticauda laticaudata TaxID=8630 RepID=A0A8C5SZ94_LATLA
MRKMESWTLVMCLLSTAFAIPLPQHPGYINFSYEVMTPLKWYQSIIGPQYPRYGYEPMGGWMHHNSGPMTHPTHFHAIHSALHQMQPPQLPQNPHLQPGPNPFVPLNGHNTLIPHYQSIQHPFQPQGEHPMQPQPPINPNQSMNPQQPGIANQPMYPLPPLIPDTPLESWPADKTKKEEVVLIET